MKKNNHSNVGKNMYTIHWVSCSGKNIYIFHIFPNKNLPKPFPGVGLLRTNGVPVRKRTIDQHVIQQGNGRKPLTACEVIQFIYRGECHEFAVGWSSLDLKKWQVSTETANIWVKIGIFLQ